MVLSLIAKFSRISIFSLQLEKFWKMRRERPKRLKRLKRMKRLRLNFRDSEIFFVTLFSL